MLKVTNYIDIIKLSDEWTIVGSDKTLIVQQDSEGTVLLKFLDNSIVVGADDLIKAVQNARNI